MVTQGQKKSKHLGTWFVVILGLLEIAAIVAFLEVKGVARTACSLSGIVPAAATSEATGIAAPVAGGDAAAVGASGGGAATNSGAATTGGSTTGTGSGGAVSAGAVALPAGGAAQDTEASDAASSAAPVSATSAPQTNATAAAAASGGTSGDASASGDTNQIVDPNCVARTAASLLSSSPAPAAGPTCGPMQQPAALKRAEAQISK
jgi:hypothetical protein